MHAVERVVGDKIDEDFGRASADSRLGAAQVRLGRTTATRLSALPGHPAYNKARGFTLRDARYLPSIRAFYTSAGLSPLIEVWAGDAGQELGRLLSEAGFYAAEVNVTLLAGPGRYAAAATRDDVDVREVAPGEDDGLYLDTLFAGYGLTGDATAPQRAMMAIEHRSTRLRRYLAYVDGVPAAAAALFRTSHGSYFVGASTIPTLRGRGCQTALIRRRLADAHTSPVVVTTAFGTPSHHNLQRLGFAIAHTRTLWRSSIDR